MTTNNEITKYWSGFQQADEYKACQDYQTQLVKSTVVTFMQLLQTSLKKLRLSDIKAMFEDLWGLALMDDDPNALPIFKMTYQILVAFLQYLIANQTIKVSESELTAFLESFKEENGLFSDEYYGDDDWDWTDDFPDRDINQDYHLAEWQERTALDIQDYTNDWLTAYCQSKAWQQRPDGVDQEFLTVVVNALVERGYDHYRKTPKSWTKAVLVAILATTMVDDFDFSESELQAIVPMLNQFLAFVASQGWINAKRVANYQRYLQAGVDKMLAAAKKKAAGPDPLDLVIDQMQREGIDIHDWDAVEAYFDQMKADGSYARLLHDMYGEDDDDTAPDNVVSLDDARKAKHKH